MPAHVLVPLKRLDDVKTRLAGVLPIGERSALMLEMLSGVLAALKEADVGPITIVSSEELSPNGVSVFDDRGLAWNDALAAAMREVVTEPIVAVVSADLPLLTAQDVRALVAATPERGMAIARARDGGTNAVSMRPAGAVETHFGEPQSADMHARAAEAAGLDACILDVPGLAFDIDTPDDLDAFRKGQE
ncbi:MAG TPA: 2-phospho-L-lactate guanylyltransferase [Gaiellaceae bacterium]|nr:2-phospho-L-lactate guanylyltransferase [Gaiellaceae bacterium]